VAPGRSVLPTTQSMEEADALATRAAILSRRLLAIGSTQELRQQFSNLYHVHLVLKTAPHSSADEMQRVEGWIRREFVNVTFEGQSLGGQVRFMVPALGNLPVGEKGGDGDGDAGSGEGERFSSSSSSSSSPVQGQGGGGGGGGGVGFVINVLERNREELGLQEYSVGAPTLERVFLSVVKDNYVNEDEEGMKRPSLWRTIFGRK